MSATSAAFTPSSAVNVSRGFPDRFRAGPGRRGRRVRVRRLAQIVWRQVFAWLRRKHRTLGWKALRRRYCDGGWWPHDVDTTLLRTGSISITRYWFRGAAIPTPWKVA
jgi:RNA-directed DNA polymerase